MAYEPSIFSSGLFIEDYFSDAGSAPRYSVSQYLHTYVVSLNWGVVRAPTPWGYVCLPWLYAPPATFDEVCKLAYRLLEDAAPTLPTRVTNEEAANLLAEPGVCIQCGTDEEFFLAPAGAGRICRTPNGDLAMGLIEPDVRWFRIVPKPPTIWKRIRDSV